MGSRLFSLDLGRVHFGDGGLEKSAISVASDTLFSALCIEALKVGGERQLGQLVSSAADGTLRFTDALPYVRHDADRAMRLLVPKPLVEMRSVVQEPAAGELSDSVTKKLAKRIQFVPLDRLADFSAGHANLGELACVQSMIGAPGVADRAAIHNGKDDADPYRVGFFAFERNAGLWILASGSASELELMASLLDQLAHVGLGGERSSGYGQFALTVADVPRELADRVRPDPVDGRLMLLATSLPGHDELSQALEGATYRLIKRSGFVASHTYFDTPRRKRDIYKFASGSIFSEPFAGVIADVGNGGSHLVFSYAKPMFLSLPEVAR